MVRKSEVWMVLSVLIVLGFVLALSPVALPGGAITKAILFSMDILWLLLSGYIPNGKAK